MPPFKGPYTLAYARKRQRRQYRAAKAMPVVLSRPARRRPRPIPRELKFRDIAFSVAVDQTIEIPATFGQAVLIPQGDTETIRDGRFAWITSVQMHAMAVQDVAVSPTPAAFDLWLILDTQANQAAAANTDVFNNATASQALRNMERPDRFRILKKMTIAPSKAGVAQGTVAVGTVFTWPFDFFYKFQSPLKITYNSTAGVIGEITQNNLFWMWGSYNYDDAIVVTGQTRIRFYSD